MPVTKDEFVQRYLTPGHPSSFAGITKLKQIYKDQLSEKQIKSFLRTIYAYSLHRQYNKPRKLRYNPFYCYRPRSLVMADLASMLYWNSTYLPDQNDDYKYIMVIIDCFSRRVFLSPMKQKHQNSSLTAIKALMEKIKSLHPYVYPRKMLTDRGTEFLNRPVKTYLSSVNIKLLTSATSTKASLAERVIRTLKGLIYRYLTQNETFKYIDKLSSLLDTYNNRPHRSLGKFTPFQADQQENTTAVLELHIERYEKIRKAAIKRRSTEDILRPGQMVRIRNKISNAFRRGFHENFSSQYYEIVKVHKKMPNTMYSIKSMDTNQLHPARFYREMLEPINSDEFRIERVLGRRLRGGKNQIRVKWSHFGPAHNSWIDEDQITEDFDSINDRTRNRNNEIRQKQITESNASFQSLEKQENDARRERR